jgi:glyoxylase-like metal-dependent hydrolase (beta-lactamase superfamily II)
LALRALLLMLFAGLSCQAACAEPFHFIPGALPLDKGPDGNSIVLDAPDGLIVFDTGRHPEHAKAILDYAITRHEPIAAVINSHWHLDHTTGNWDIRKAYPHVAVYASSAIDGALATFLEKSREQMVALLADPKTSAVRRDQFERAIAVIDHPERIRPDHIIERSARMRIAGRSFDVHLAKFAATEGDVWLYDRKTRTVIAGDLVVGTVPFMDTACPDGWSKALGEIASLAFTTLIPGHGQPMTRSDFDTWRAAYVNFVACGRSSAASRQCIDGWQRDAAKFIDDQHRDYVRQAAAYYIDTRLRSSPDEKELYCKPLKPD